MDKKSVTSSSSKSQAEYSKKVQMIMTSNENPMINFQPAPVPAATTSGMRQRGLLSQVSYLPTSSAPEQKKVKNPKQCKTYSSINSLPGSYMLADQPEVISKKSSLNHKNRTTFDLPEEPVKKARTINPSKLDHQHDVLRNEIYDEEPSAKRSIYATANKLSHKFDIFGNETEVEAAPKSAKNWRGNKLEHHYDIFKQFEPVS